MAVTTSQQIAKYYEQFQNTDVTLDHPGAPPQYEAGLHQVPRVPVAVHHLLNVDAECQGHHDDDAGSERDPSDPRTRSPFASASSSGKRPIPSPSSSPPRSTASLPMATPPAASVFSTSSSPSGHRMISSSASATSSRRGSPPSEDGKSASSSPPIRRRSSDWRRKVPRSSSTTYRGKPFSGTSPLEAPKSSCRGFPSFSSTNRR